MSATFQNDEFQWHPACGANGVPGTCIVQSKWSAKSGTFFQLGLGPTVFNDVVENWADELILPHHFVKKLVDKILNIL